MAKAKWRDETSYLQGERGKIEPRIWELHLENKKRRARLRISVHKHIHYGDAWLVSCYEVGIDKLETKLSGQDQLEDAKAFAVKAVYNKVREMMDLIEGR